MEQKRKERDKAEKKRKISDKEESDITPQDNSDRAIKRERYTGWSKIKFMM